MLRDAAVAKFPGLFGFKQAALVSTLALLVPDKEDVVRYTSVSGFIFLRFFAPAILNPRLFHLRPECPVSI